MNLKNVDLNIQTNLFKTKNQRNSLQVFFFRYVHPYGIACIQFHKFSKYFFFRFTFFVVVRKEKKNYQELHRAYFNEFFFLLLSN